MNYYNVNGEITLVDLPGYGYAKVDESFRKKWGDMIEKYLNSSRDLKGILLLVDIRHKPTADDISMYEWIAGRDMKCAVIATKSDKLKRSELSKALSVIKNTLRLREEDILIPFSAQTKTGRDEVCAFIDDNI